MGIVLLIIAIVLLIVVIYQFATSYPVSNNSVTTFTGAPGTSKTYNITRLALKAYKKQRFKHQIYQIFPGITYFFPEAKSPATLYSNYPIRLRREVYSETLKPEHLLMYEPLPQEAIVCITEFGSICSQFDFDNPYCRENIADFIRFFGQFLGRSARLFMDDQSYEMILKFVRVRMAMIYQLVNFRRFWLLPFFKVNVIPLLQVNDTASRLVAESEELPHIFGFLPYKWMSKLVPSLRKYDSRCYSRIYFEGASHTFDPYDQTLKTRSFIDVSASFQLQRLYKNDPQSFKEYLYTPMALRASFARGVRGDAGGAPSGAASPRTRERT